MKQYGIFYNIYTNKYNLNDKGNLFSEEKHTPVYDENDLKKIISYIINEIPDHRKKLLIKTNIPDLFFNEAKDEFKKKYGSHVIFEYVISEGVESSIKKLKEEQELKKLKQDLDDLNNQK